MKQTDVIIIGAGWSGLACAVSLVDQGYKVCLLESAQQVGGRARTVKFKHFINNKNLDNGQHIMLGAYHSTLRLFKHLEIDTSKDLERQPLKLSMYSAKPSDCKEPSALIELKTPSLPAPFHLLFAFMTMKGLSVIERFKIIKMALYLKITHYQLKQDISVEQLLKKHRQSRKVIKVLWEPLCLASLNTPISYASAQIFLKVLKDSFNHKHSDSDLLFFLHDISHTFCQPATHFIQQHGSEVKCNEKVINIEKMQLNKTQQFFVQTQNNSFQCHNIVLATPAYITQQLIQTMAPETNVLMPDTASLSFDYEPICTIYLQYPASVQLPQRMIGFFNTTAQWAIDRSLTTHAGLIAVIISGPGSHIKREKKQLADTIHQELSLCLADLPDYLDYQVITEKRATFSCQVNIEQQRPANDTQISGLFLAGDYTNTQYPSTLEGAIKSGQSAAKHLINTNFS